MIFGSIIGAALNYTRQGRVSLTLGELVGTPDPEHCLCTRMIINDEGVAQTIEKFNSSLCFGLTYLNF